MLTQTYLEKLSFEIVGCFIEVHKELGPGLLESVYHSCLIDELSNRNLSFTDHPYVPVIYKERFLGGRLQMDILVEDLIVLELKSVEIMIPLYKAQLITYLKLTNKHKGILVNFNSEVITKQIVHVVRPTFFELRK